MSGIMANSSIPRSDSCDRGWKFFKPLRYVEDAGEQTVASGRAGGLLGHLYGFGRKSNTAVCL